MNAFVRPHPGQLKPSNVFHKQGIQISMPEADFNMVENKK
jgi:hypothetical protein